MRKSLFCDAKCDFSVENRGKIGGERMKVTCWSDHRRIEIHF